MKITVPALAYQGKIMLEVKSNKSHVLGKGITFKS